MKFIFPGSRSAWKITHSRKADFGPRSGAAYRVFDGRAVRVRGGYSHSYFHINLAHWWIIFVNTPTNASYRYNPNNATNRRTASRTTAEDHSLGSDGRELAQRGPSRQGLGHQPRHRAAHVLRAEKAGLEHPELEPDRSRRRSCQYHLSRPLYLATTRATSISITVTTTILPSYIWYASTLQPFRPAPRSSVGDRHLRPDHVGQSPGVPQIGWSNNNGFQFEVERRFATAWPSSSSTLPAKHWRCRRRESRHHQRRLCSTSSSRGRFRRIPAAQLRFLNYQRDTACPSTGSNGTGWSISQSARASGSEITPRRALHKFIGGWQVAGLGSSAAPTSPCPPATGISTARSSNTATSIRSELHQRRMRPRLPLVERLYSAEPDQQPRCQGQANG